MVRERVLTISTLLAFVALSGVAHAGPRITDKNYWLNEVAPSSQSTTAAQTQPDWYRARAMQPGAAPVPEGTSGQYGCRYRYQAGPKSSFAC